MIKPILSLCLYAAGFITIGYYTQWQVSAGLFLVLWAFNLESRNK